jgi:hypothetical protein
MISLCLTWPLTLHRPSLRFRRVEQSRGRTIHSSRNCRHDAYRGDQAEADGKSKRIVVNVAPAIALSMDPNPGFTICGSYLRQPV